MNNLSAAGLNTNEALAYKTLMSKKEWKASELANVLGESRTNMYKILDKLVLLKLADKDNKNKTLKYRANNPSRLIELARIKKQELEAAENELTTFTQNLSEQYIRVNEMPGIRYYQGKDEIETIYKNMSLSKTEISFIHSSASVDFFSFDILHNLRMMAVKNKIPRRAITSDGPRSPKDYKEKDPLVYLKRTWLAQNEYTAPVEIGVYENIIYIISFGEEAIGLTIESPQISKAFNQILDLLSIKQKQSKGYKLLPKVAQGIARTN